MSPIQTAKEVSEFSISQDLFNDFKSLEIEDALNQLCNYTEKLLDYRFNKGYVLSKEKIDLTIKKMFYLYKIESILNKKNSKVLNELRGFYYMDNAFLGRNYNNHLEKVWNSNPLSTEGFKSTSEAEMILKYVLKDIGKSS